MKVAVERYIEQVADGSHYKGHVKIAGIKFDYELKVNVEMPKFDPEHFVVRIVMPEDKNELRRSYEITVRKKHKQIELDDEEYIFFFHMLVQFTVDFYNEPMTRGAQELMFLHHLLPGMAQLSPEPCLGVGNTQSGECDFSPELCKMLSTPKFGCKLAG